MFLEGCCSGGFREQLAASLLFLSCKRRCVVLILRKYCFKYFSEVGLWSLASSRRTFALKKKKLKHVLYVLLSYETVCSETAMFMLSLPERHDLSLVLVFQDCQIKSWANSTWLSETKLFFFFFGVLHPFPFDFSLRYWLAFWPNYPKRTLWIFCQPKPSLHWILLLKFFLSRI